MIKCSCNILFFTVTSYFSQCSFADRGFQFVTPRLWSSLPLQLRFSLRLWRVKNLLLNFSCLARPSVDILFLLMLLSHFIIFILFWQVAFSGCLFVFSILLTVVQCFMTLLMSFHRHKVYLTIALKQGRHALWPFALNRGCCVLSSLHFTVTFHLINGSVFLFMFLLERS